MTADEKRIAGVTDGTELATIRDAVVSLVAAEKQRVVDKAESDALRAQVRIAEDRWKSGVESTLGDLKRGLEEVRGAVSRLPSAVYEKLTAAALLSATALKTEAALRATDLKASAALVATEKRRAENKAAVSTFLSRGVRIAMSVAVLVAISLIAYLFFRDGETDVGEVATLLAICSPFIIFVFTTSRKRPP